MKKVATGKPIFINIVVDKTNEMNLKINDIIEYEGEYYQIMAVNEKGKYYMNLNLIKVYPMPFGWEIAR